ncbi:LacI family DNA-binding transcriptional regulator [Capnocytophaga catalasegens]|uniref:LacI family transcriptional regulator n=1 Tax=Capnocytophaga catalasegens TaxID=1004260 RepID=A0AAV5ARR5_9FLAO|nr:LacI family DNA-binding transcriptional regulator [Capnocytophaga catalasegens]GIZ15091.1 LacI family transcriptional regulator [Capnocytophaga catalasegens]GJM50024.1 LacI family transcriptional regulator [Capnocytophaga catalasegens]GJM53895.1 LacI family transcriptional regulator [Capnocytophaga catalasegens]
MKKRITIKQLAKELNVSISTVSKSLNNSKEISEETKERIRAFAQVHNYKPNPIALRLKNKRSQNIGVIIPEIAHDFFSTVVSGIEQVAYKKGYNITVCFTNEQFDREVQNMDTLANTNIDGFIIAVSKETQQLKDYHHLREAINQGFPIVLFDRIIDSIYCDKVISDDAMAAYNATNNLIETGYRRIALLTIPDYISIGQLRTQGYKNALNDAGYPIDDNLILPVEDIHSDQIIIDFFDTRIFDAVVCANEFLALKVIRQAHDRGIKIPQQLGIIGFADGFLARNSYPKLTAIDQHPYEMGKTAAKLLIKTIERNNEEKPFRTEIIKTTLIERETTRKL